MQDKRAAPRWRLKQSEQRALLILGDLIAGYLALLVALYFWAAGDAWLQFSLEFLKLGQIPGFIFCLSSGLFCSSIRMTSTKLEICNLPCGGLVSLPLQLFSSI